MEFLLHQLLTESASKYPDREAVVFEDDSVTYAGLERESNALAQFLLKSGTEKGDCVGIYMNRCISSIVSVFGILKAGATYVPIDPVCPPDRLRYIMDSCGMKYILCSKEKLTNLERVLPEDSVPESIIVMNGLEKGYRIQAPLQLIDWQEYRETSKAYIPYIGTTDRDLAYILFTSGSTGTPKGVMITHLNALTFINAAHDLFQISVHDRFSNICPMHFDMSVFDLFVAIKAGATVVIIPETTTMFPIKLAEIIEKKSISVWNSVPSALSLLAAYKDLGAHDLSSLRLVLFAGELFPLKYLRIMKENVPGARFCNMYGQTEANSSTYYWIDQLPPDDKTAIPIGRPLPNFEVFALDDEGNKVTGLEQEGELYVRASSVAAGYWDDAEKTEKAFVRHPFRPYLNERVYKTGDLVRLDIDGNYIFIGRKDHMIKSRGYRIEIGEIETVLCSHPGVKNAVVVPVPDELLGNRISGIVTPIEPGKASKEDILQFCARRLPRYMLPENIEFRDHLPTTSSGKVDRKKLSDHEKVMSCP